MTTTFESYVAQRRAQIEAGQRAAEEARRQAVETGLETAFTLVRDKPLLYTVNGAARAAAQPPVQYAVRDRLARLAREGVFAVEDRRLRLV